MSETIVSPISTDVPKLPRKGIDWTAVAIACGLQLVGMYTGAAITDNNVDAGVLYYMFYGLGLLILSTYGLYKLVKK